MVCPIALERVREHFRLGSLGRMRWERTAVPDNEFGSPRSIPDGGVVPLLWLLCLLVVAVVSLAVGAWLGIDYRALSGGAVTSFVLVGARFFVWSAALWLLWMLGVSLWRPGIAPGVVAQRSRKLRVAVLTVLAGIIFSVAVLPVSIARVAHHADLVALDGALGCIGALNGGADDATARVAGVEAARATASALKLDRVGMTTSFGPTVMISSGPTTRGHDQLVWAPPFEAVVTRRR